MASPEQRAARSARLRRVFAQVTAHRAGASRRVERAFAETSREIFAGPPPWQIAVFGPAGPAYLTMPDDDPAWIYQDNLVALDAAKGLNIGEPVLHARCIEALAPQPGETVLHIGAGSGYYTAILPRLVGPTGAVIAYEIEPALATRATDNLRPMPWVTVVAGSGAAEGLPPADAIYVSAGLAAPCQAWLEALRPHGRLLFPLQAPGSFGGMLLAQKPHEGGLSWPARFVQRAAFVGCRTEGPPAEVAGLAAAFDRGDWDAVQALHLDAPPDESCWSAGDGWWLSRTAPVSA